MMRDFFPAHGQPCDMCGVRPDVGCVHRAADASYVPPVQRDEHDKRKLQKGQTRSYGDRTIASGAGAYRIKAARKAGKLPAPFA